MEEVQVQQLTLSDNISVFMFAAGPVATNAFLCVDTVSGRAFLVDAPVSSAAVVEQLVRQLDCTLEALYLTHSHWDHTADCADLQEAFPALSVYVHRADAYRLPEPMKHTVWQLPFPIKPVEKFEYFADDLSTDNTGLLRDIGFSILFTPGHTEGGVCFYQKDINLLFAGDTLFQGSVGRTDLPGGNTEQLIASIHSELMILPDEVVVCCGHGPITTIGREKLTNPFLQESL